MQFLMNQHKNDFLFLPLGGSGQIGMNFNTYYYKGKWLVVDCGAGFAEEYFPGIEMTIPDISFLLPFKKDILGIVLTHAHEDHIGGVQHLWKKLGCPIYATNFTAAFLKARLKDNGFKLPNEIIALNPKSKIDLNPFTVEMVPLCHSAPEMQALVISTDEGSVFHTGDWKFDADPVIGEVNDEALLAEYGKKGILAVIGDSTNVFNEEYSGSESKLKQSLIDLVCSAKEMVVVTTFASNLARLDSLITAAKQSGRHIALAGRSLKRVMAAAKSVGYFQDGVSIIDEYDISKYGRDKVLLVCTGCQGEPLAALTKIASGTHPKITLKKDDTVIFSSKIIPGNDKRIFRLFNKLVKKGAQILTERDHFVHVSGHPGKKELIRLYTLLKPQLIIPVHGEHVHMHEHAKIAQSLGVASIEVENGDVVRLSQKGSEKVGKVPADELGIYGNRFLRSDCDIMKMRKKLKYDGIFSATMIVDRNFQLMLDPIIFTLGFMDETEGAKIIDEIKSEIEFTLEDANIPGVKKDSHLAQELETLLRSKIKGMLNVEFEKVPVV